MSTKIIKVCCNTWENESRDTRELEVCKQLGMEVKVFAKGDETHTSDKQNGFDVIRCKTKILKDIKLFKLPNKILSIFYWANKLKKLNADILSCHDIPALFIGYLSNVGKKHKAKLIYDSHEFELGRNTKRSKIATNFIKRLEKFLINKSALTVVVSDSIADELVKIYRLDNRPLVVRNIPQKWNLDEELIRETRGKINKQLNCDDNQFLMLFHGRIRENCGIEDDIEALKYLDDTKLIILGYGDKDYLERLKALTREAKVEKDVLFLPAVPLNELYKYCGAADIGLCNILATCKSYYFALPNKLFENIQSLNPVIVSNFPEMGQIVDNYNIGFKVEPGNVDALVEVLTNARIHKKAYDNIKQNMPRAKEELCWEKESQVLKKAYRELMR